MASPNLLSRLGSVNVTSYLAQYKALADRYHVTPDFIRTVAPTAAAIVVSLAGEEVSDPQKATDGLTSILMGAAALLEGAK